MHEKYMEIALEEAELALLEGNIPIGCCIVINGEVVSRAHNEVDSKKNDTLHAEFSAISKVATALFEKKGQATLYTTLEPCAMCLGAMAMVGIRKLVYATSDGFVGSIQSLKKQEFYCKKINEITHSVLSSRSQKLLNSYVEKSNCRHHLRQ